jgi:protein gp37
VNDTAIEWTNVTWNPVSGCEKISPGCAFCYAHTTAENKRGTKAFPNGFDLTYRPHKLDEPRHLKTPSLIFVNSMSDFAWEQISDEYRDQILDVIEQTPQHEYQVLTKRPDNLLRYSKRRKLPPNFWAGVTIESQAYASRLNVLKQIDAAVRFVSAEPLLGPLELDWTGIHWCIAGGESGMHLWHRTRREHRALVDRVNGIWVPTERGLAWVRRIRNDCLASRCAFFHKQWGGPTPKAAGRELDGRTWDDYPKRPAAPQAAEAITRFSAPSQRMDDESP